MVEPQFTLFKMQEEFLVRESIELGKSPLGKAPEAFDSIHMTLSSSKFVLRMVDAIGVIAV